MVLGTSVSGGAYIALLTVSDGLQATEWIFGLVIIGIAGFFTIRARSADIWRQSYEGMKELHDAKANELIEVHRHLVEAQAKIAVFEQAPRYEDVAAMFQQIADANTSERNAILSNMTQISRILSNIEQRLEAGNR